MQDPQDDDPLVFDKIGNEVGEAGDDELTRAFHAPRAADAGVLLEELDLAQNLQDGIDRRQGVIVPDVGLDRLQVAASAGSPL